METTPLNTSSVQYTEEAEYEDFSLSTRARRILYVCGGLGILVSLWFFCFFLPALFIPQPVQLSGIVKVSDLGVELESRKVARLIMVGDVHGHYDELQKLLDKAKYERGKDHLLMLGDFITKGPDSFKVLDFLIDNKADCILGNHELYVLQNYARFHNLREPFFTDASEGAVSLKSDFNTDPEFLLAKKLLPHHVAYINQCSVIKKLGPMPVQGKKTGSTAPGVAVHAGLRWDLNLEDQDPMDALEMRSYIGPYYNETSSDPFAERAVSWSRIFNKKQEEGSAMVVYYGHDARRGLNLKRYTKGLDSGCDRGERLSGMVVWRGGEKEEVVQVEC